MMFVLMSRWRSDSIAAATWVGEEARLLFELIELFCRIHQPVFIAHIMEESLRSQGTTYNKSQKAVIGGYDPSKVILDVGTYMCV